MLDSIGLWLSENSIWFIPSLMTFTLIVVTVLIFYRQKRDNRIDHFIQNFNNNRETGYSKRVIQYLIPSGINNLTNDKEIKMALSNIENIHGRHPLQTNNEEIKKIGYKKFFLWSSKERDSLTKNNIKDFIDKYKKAH
ncbi:MAG: hypothetical protein KAJ62_12900 [Desulfobacteraceae bacterium]|nr:hypothetical protein [Desulfobacteraceae bacterium]